MSESVPRLDFDELDAATRRGGPPTADDVIVLFDGTRLDTPAKARAWIEDFVHEREAAMEADAAERQH